MALRPGAKALLQMLLRVHVHSIAGLACIRVFSDSSGAMPAPWGQMPSAASFHNQDERGLNPAPITFIIAAKLRLFSRERAAFFPAFQSIFSAIAPAKTGADLKSLSTNGQRHKTDGQRHLAPPHAGLTRSAGVMGLTGRQGDP